MTDTDLFGQPVTEPLPVVPGEKKKRVEPKPAGYFAPPGTGPEGHFCKDCQHLCRKRMANTYLKCALMRRTWTGGGKTDVRSNSPACCGWVLAERIVR